jgi:isoamylase
MTDYKSWRLVLNATEAKQIVVDFLDSGADTKAPPRSVLAFMGRT